MIFQGEKKLWVRGREVSRKTFASKTEKRTKHCPGKGQKRDSRKETSGKCISEADLGGM